MMELTHDTFFSGRIRISQKKYGYRFSIDAILLADWARDLKPGLKVLDLGTGCGIIPLILGYRCPEIRIYGVELQAEPAKIAAFNVKNNQMEDRIRIFCMDMKDLRQDVTSGTVGCVVSNPPYRRARSGRVNPDSERAVARHEIRIDLYQLLATAGRMLKKSGSFFVVYPAERLADMIAQMRGADIEPKRLRMVCSKGGEGAKLILIKGVKGGRPGIAVEPPLIIYEDDGSYTPEVTEMFAP